MGLPTFAVHGELTLAAEAQLGELATAGASATWAFSVQAGDNSYTVGTHGSQISQLIREPIASARIESGGFSQ